MTRPLNTEQKVTTWKRCCYDVDYAKSKKKSSQMCDASKCKTILNRDSAPTFCNHTIQDSWCSTKQPQPPNLRKWKAMAKPPCHQATKTRETTRKITIETTWVVCNSTLIIVSGRLIHSTAIMRNNHPVWWVTRLTDALLRARCPLHQQRGITWRCVTSGGTDGLCELLKLCSGLDGSSTGDGHLMGWYASIQLL